MLLPSLPLFQELQPGKYRAAHSLSFDLTVQAKGHRPFRLFNNPVALPDLGDLDGQLSVKGVGDGKARLGRTGHLRFRVAADLCFFNRIPSLYPNKES